MDKLKEWVYVLKQQQMYDQKEGQGIPGTLTIRLCLVAAGIPRSVWVFSSFPKIATLFSTINKAESSTCFIMAAANDQSGFFDGCMD